MLPASVLNREPFDRSVTIPYVRGVAERICKVLTNFNVRVHFKPLCKLSSFFNIPKDPVSLELTRGVVYQLKCRDCDIVYVGQTKNSLKTRVSQHRAASRLLQPEKSAIAEHSIDSDHRIDWENPVILTRQAEWRKRLFLEAWWTERHRDVAVNRCEAIPSVYRPLICNLHAVPHR